MFEQTPKPQVVGSSPSAPAIHPQNAGTFKNLTDARMWAQSTEAAMRERRYFKTAGSQKHTVAETIDRYIEKLKQIKLDGWLENSGIILCLYR